MQLFGAVSLLFCVISILGVIEKFPMVATGAFLTELILMAVSLACLIHEISISGGAMRIMLNEMEGRKPPND